MNIQKFLIWYKNFISTNLYLKSNFPVWILDKSNKSSIIPDNLWIFLLAIEIKLFIWGVTSPVWPDKTISKELLIGVNGVLNSWETMDTNSDFNFSSFSSFLFVIEITYDLP